MSAFRTIWRQWHIPGARNWRVQDVDPGDYHMLDGVEDWIRHSMQLRTMSERNLRQVKQDSGWSNDVLVEHLNGEHDAPDTYDEEIYDRLAYNGLEGEAHKFVPGRWLNDFISTQTQKEPSGSWRVLVHYSADRFLAAQPDWPLDARDVVGAPIPRSCVALDGWEGISPSWPYTFELWKQWQQRGTPPEPQVDKPIESEEFGYWGGCTFVARGSKFVWVASQSAEAVNDSLLEHALPTAFDPDDFEGLATLSGRV